MAAGKITLFDDGRFVGVRTSSTIEQLFCRGLVTLEHNKKGFVVAAHVVHLAGTNETSQPDQRLFAAATIPPVTRYSYRDSAIETKPWELRRLNGRRSGLSYASGTDPTDFLNVIGSCLRTPLPASRELRNNRSMQETLYLSLFYESPASKLTVARIEQHPIFCAVARVALVQAQKRGDETTRLERLLETVLPGFKENSRHWPFMKIDWGAARSDYVNHANLTYAAIARKYKAHKVTIQKRATRENWIAERAQKAALLLQKVTEKTVLNTAEELAKYNEQDLIAAKSLRALAAKRMQRANEGVALEPKDVRALAATIESAQRIARLALGAATQVNDVTLNEADKLTQEERLERIRQLHKQLFPDDEKIH